jgi:hypothetical protein
VLSGIGHFHEDRSVADRSTAAAPARSQQHQEKAGHGVLTSHINLHSFPPLHTHHYHHPCTKADCCHTPVPLQARHYSDAFPVLELGDYQLREYEALVHLGEEGDGKADNISLGSTKYIGVIYGMVDHMVGFFRGPDSLKCFPGGLKQQVTGCGCAAASAFPCLLHRRCLCGQGTSPFSRCRCKLRVPSVVSVPKGLWAIEQHPAVFRTPETHDVCSTPTL